MLDSKGQGKVVVIGVGGFLEIGQKDVGVPFSDLQWKNQAEGRTAANSNGGSSASNAAADAAARGYPDHAMLDATKQQLQNAPDFKFAPNNNNSNTGDKAGAPAMSR